MKNIIVFGATGGTGRYLINYLKEHCDSKEYTIIASGRRDSEEFAGVQYIPVDITKKDAFEKLPNEAYAVVDLAGLMPARMKGYNPERYIEVNILGTLNILEYCRKVRTDRILFAQSFGDIKDHAEKMPLLTTNLPRKFSFTTDHTVYVMSKNFAVDLIENYHQMYGLKNFIFRLPTIYLYEKNSMYYVDGIEKKMAWRLLIEKAIAGEAIEVWGDSTRVKDMVYIKDFCQMLYRAILVERDGGYYNVGTGVGTSLLDQIKGIIEVFGDGEHKSKLIMRPDLPNAPQYIMDIEPARKELGYTPHFTYIEWLKDFKKEMIKDN